MNNIITSTSFAQQIKQADKTLRRDKITTLQLNIGKRCNQACHHCHVESGPDHTENMNGESIDRLLTLLEQDKNILTVDITGGAPELNPHFRRFVTAIRAMGKKVINRCNLTILFEAGQEDTANFLADQGIHIVASLPCYSQKNVDAQRGKNVFEKSIQALQLLNALGYGTDENLKLDLVYNPGGAFLPPPQQQLERDYKDKLFQDFGIQFNQLYAITNMPIKRFEHQLHRDGLLEDYMQLLLDNFNPDALDNVMCKNQISIGFDGAIYDCDFNQMLDIPVSGKTLDIFSIQRFDDINTFIAVADHCFACTAGSGSSCGGSLV
ncbi:MAG: arsenosugar biosynthesis radical SAM protein ArsS [Pseudomonadales bacterium]|nr:arsenosugar biosynthesis radical SAM protein ArsS [Pseudomonadales bacterium]